MKKILFALLSLFFLLIFLFLSINYEDKIYRKKIYAQKGFIKIFQFLTFKEQKYENLQKKIDKNLLTSKFDKLKFNTIKLNKRDFDRPLGYLEVIKENIIYLGANGDFLLIDDNFSKNEIKSNLNSYFNNEIKKEELFNSYLLNPVRDLLYHDGFLYVVFVDITMINNEINFSSSVLKGKFNFDYIDFRYFFKPNSFVKETDDPTTRIGRTHTGGRIVVDKDNNFFIAVPDYDQPNIVQSKDNIFGKILQVLSLTDYKIISIGHRNPQGFYYDKEKDIFIESEHGPAGGDEINLIKPNKNYGWPIVSTGTFSENITKFHNHKKQGYYPPIYTWPIWSPGISQIIKIKKKSKFNYRELYMVASLSGYNKFYGNHLYLFDIDENKAILKDKIFIGDRVRDLVYDEINDRIILAIENQESIAIIDLFE